MRSSRLLPAALLTAACPGEPDPVDPIAWSWPAADAADVRVDTAVRVALHGLTEDPAGAVTVALDPAVAVDLSWDEVAHVLTAWPAAPLAPETAYTVTVTAPEATAAWSFTTGRAIPGADGTDRWCEGNDCATFTVSGRESLTRHYRLETTHPLRDNNPPGAAVELDELPGQVVLRTGNDVVDGLFAMTVHEARVASVSSITDGAFLQGQPVDCDCFETGELWRYVWTRDTAYAVDLGLAWLDPARSANSLRFKLSERKLALGGGEAQVVQDTGSGGSWPVSTDRVVWAIGARRLIAFLDGAERDAFAAEALEALVTTAEIDRDVAFDPADGLYRGEQSFLDWREQSYPSWTAADTVTLAMSKALSTNLGHHALLSLAADLCAEAGRAEEAARYRAWADDLAAAIDRELWLDEGPGWSTMKTSTLDPAPVHRFDLLGTALAAEALGGERARAALAAYPHAAHGPPVQHPQLPDAPVYHNQGIWPFVTAYGVRAAARADLPAQVAHDAAGMVRGAALNVSNMENFELFTGANWRNLGERSGPVVNSRRQLWSVAGFLSLVVDTWFGLEATGEGLRFRPFLPGETREDLFGHVDALTLHHFPYKGRALSVTLRLPAQAQGATAAATIQSVTLDGVEVGERLLSDDELADGARIVITLGNGAGEAPAVVPVGEEADPTAWQTPREPAITGVSRAPGGLTVAFTGPQSATRFAIYRDGVRVADDLQGPTWVDTEADPDRSPCYAAEAVWTTSGLRSHHSRPWCWWGETSERVAILPADTFEVEGGVWSTEHGRPHWGSWGEADHTASARFTPTVSGTHLVSVEYGNGAGPINTGITTGNKRLLVDGAPAGWLVMPHLGSWSRWAESSFVPVQLQAGVEVELSIVDGLNMSYLRHFSIYTGGNGGGGAPYHAVNLAAIRVLARP